MNRLEKEYKEKIVPSLTEKYNYKLFVHPESLLQGRLSTAVHFCTVQIISSPAWACATSATNRL